MLVDKLKLQIRKSQSVVRAVRAKEKCRRYREAAMWGKHCIDCDMADPLVLDFYPKDDSVSKVNSGKTVNWYKNHGNFNLMMIEIEENSVIRCANCQIRHLAKHRLDKNLNERLDTIEELKAQLKAERIADKRRKKLRRLKPRA